MNKYEDMNIVELEELQDKLENDINNFETGLFEMIYPKYIMGFEIEQEEYEKIENSFRELDKAPKSIVDFLCNYIDGKESNKENVDKTDEETDEYKESLINRRNDFIKNYNTFRNLCSEKSEVFQEIKNRRLGRKM